MDVAAQPDSGPRATASLQQQQQQQQHGEQPLSYSKRHRVFVGGIAPNAEGALHSYFSVFGKVVECKIVMDAETHKSKGYAFITYESEEVAERVRQCGLLYFQGKLMNTGEVQRSMRVNAPGNGNNNGGVDGVNNSNLGFNQQYTHDNNARDVDTDSKFAK